jgi:hypothetical protein
VLVGVILTGYFSVLKKNGWIGKTSFEKELKTSSFQSQPEQKTQNAFDSLIEAKEPKPKKNGKEPQTQKAVLSMVKSNENKNSPREKPKKADETQKDKHSGCNHYFGYLSTLPKMTATPEECYFCAKLLECYKETEK